MPVINFYLNNELFIKLKNEENRSALISQLLEAHYLKTVRPNVKEIETEISQMKERTKLLEDTRTKVIVEKQVEEITEQQQFEKGQKKMLEKWEAVRRNASSFFPEFSLLEKNEQDKLIDDYLNNNPDSLNVIMFLNTKGFKDNIEDDKQQNK